MSAAAMVVVLNERIWARTTTAVPTLATLIRGDKPWAVRHIIHHIRIRRGSTVVAI